VLIELAHAPYRSENDLYAIASGVAWEIWFTPKQTFKIETTAQHSPLTSLNFATLRIKDAIADRFRAKAHGVRPSIETQRPDVRVFAHLTTDSCTLYIDTSGEPLFKRGWRQDTGDAPLKETLAAAMLAASGWWNPETGAVSAVPLYDPCCGSGTIAIEAAQIGLGIPAGALRRFGFEKLLPFQPHVWDGDPERGRRPSPRPVSPPIFGSDVSHRMVDFAERNAERAGVARGDPVPRRRCACSACRPKAHRRGRDRAEPAVRRAHRGRWRGRRASRAHAQPRPRRARATMRRVLQPAGEPLEEELRGLDRLDAHARPAAAQAHAAEGVAPRADVERTHRMPAVPLRHGGRLGPQAGYPLRRLRHRWHRLHRRLRGLPLFLAAHAAGRVDGACPASSRGAPASVMGRTSSSSYTRTAIGSPTKFGWPK
jgi:hypothetical protein